MKISSIMTNCATEPVLGTVLGRLEARWRGCAPLAGKSTPNHLEHAAEGAHRA